MNLENTISLNKNLDNAIDLKKEQNSFLNSFLGKAINTGLDVGLRALLPDFIEDQVINIKDNLLNFGLKDGIKKTIEETIDLGKSALGIITGNFDNVNQVEMATKKGGLIDNFSNLFDSVLNKINEKKAINPEVVNLIKQGKNSILKSVESNIDKSFTNQMKNMSDLDKYIKNWKNAYDERDFSNMEKQFKKINKEIENLVPLEKTLKEARIIENIHTLIKTNGQNFDLSEAEIELVNKL